MAAPAELRLLGADLRVRPEERLSSTMGFAQRDNNDSRTDGQARLQFIAYSSCTENTALSLN